MAALVEVEIVRRDLEKEIVGESIEDVEVRPGSNAMKIIPRHGRRKELVDLLVGASIERVDRVGKKLLVGVDDSVLIIDLGSSGRLVKTTGADSLAPHTHIVVTLSEGAQLRVIDPKLTSDVFATTVPDRAEIKRELRDFAIDPLDDQFTWQRFSSLLDERDAPLRELLVDERFIVGLGPLYADEVLWHAGLRYDRSSKGLSSQDVRRLYRSLLELLQDAVGARGTSWGDDGFTDLYGNSGRFQLELKVHEREGASCRRCRSRVVKENVGDGYTYLCAQCQS